MAVGSAPATIKFSVDLAPTNEPPRPSPHGKGQALNLGRAQGKALQSGCVRAWQRARLRAAPAEGRACRRHVRGITREHQHKRAARQSACDRERRDRNVAEPLPEEPWRVASDERQKQQGRERPPQATGPSQVHQLLDFRSYSHLTHSFHHQS